MYYQYPYIYERDMSILYTKDDETKVLKLSTYFVRIQLYISLLLDSFEQTDLLSDCVNSTSQSCCESVCVFEIPPQQINEAQRQFVNFQDFM